KLKDILTKDKSLPKNAKLSGDELKFLEEFLENIENLTRRYIDIVRDTIEMRQKNDPDLIRVAGLLIKIDHAASQEGGIVEERPITGDRVRIFEQKVGTPKKFQSAYKDKENVAVVADTGMGKTGLAFLWAKRKMFYVLPNRASANAMYERLKEYAGENKVGLLHSNSLFYLINDINNDDNQDVVKEYDVIRALSKPITVTTADQLFTAVFKYPTYEKIYATLSYSDIVIDEIQAFDPKQIVPILMQMQETIELGARYLLITATLPGIVKKELKQIGIEIIDQVDETIDKTKRHKIKLVDQSVKELVESKLRDYSGKRVLIIVNNVSTAQDLYDFLKEKYKVKLLHSRFTFEDRKQKEEEIKKNEPAIWIATQIVEVSLDIDFDVLFTELAPADSLIQRMGRVWRHRTKDYGSEDLPNIYIARKYDKSKVHQIYEEQLLNKTEELLSQYDGKFLTSEAKRGIVDELYSEKFLRTTQYIKEWKDTASALNLGLYDDKNEAHRIFRNIVNVEVIHEENLGKVKRLAKEYKESTTREGRILTLSKINDMKIQIPAYYLPAYYLLGEKGEKQYVKYHNKHLGVIVVSGQYFKYDKEKGLYIIKRKD
ncbi:MAG TPA: CRISPR-associated helicase Cas3', partial [Thermodesulfobium narugense]|nr:CRISPR-associated helicase Cas3' [Thermodesulfobium narugense]